MAPPAHAHVIIFDKVSHEAGAVLTTNAHNAFTRYWIRWNRNLIRITHAAWEAEITQRIASDEQGDATLIASQEEFAAARRLMQ